MQKDPDVKVTTQARFLPKQSDTRIRRFVFAYTITISNHSPQACQLMSRFWVIEDANEKKHTVRGEGVIGQQPIIQPNESFTYTSTAMLETETGTMKGHYFMQSSELEFTVNIPEFLLSVPRVLH